VLAEDTEERCHERIKASSDACTVGGRRVMASLDAFRAGFGRGTIEES